MTLPDGLTWEFFVLFSHDNRPSSKDFIKVYGYIVIVGVSLQVFILPVPHGHNAHYDCFKHNSNTVNGGFDNKYST